MKLKVITIIIDDYDQYSEKIKNVLNERNSKSSLIEYHIIKPFSSRKCFLEAQKYILESIESDSQIDLVFCDYDLSTTGDGFDLLKLFTNTRLRPYRILHSHTTQLFPEHLNKYRLFFEDVSSSKREADITQKLEIFEEKVLKIMLYGNPNYYKEYYQFNTDFTLTHDTKLQIGNFRLIDVVCIETENNKHYITYRKYNENTIEIVEREKHTGEQYQQDNFLDQGDNLRFARFNRHITINLLWVAEINLVNTEIHFISPDFKHRKKKIDKLSSNSEYKNTFDKYLQDISKSLPDYFLIR